MADKLLEEEVSYKIRGCIFNVANKYGKGLKENIYQKALAEEFTSNGIEFVEQKRINVYSFTTGKVLGVYIPDFIVNNKVLIEIKASFMTRGEDLDQFKSYLRISIYEIGYLVNFCTERLEIKRYIFTNNNKEFIKKIAKSESV